MEETNNNISEDESLKTPPWIKLWISKHEIINPNSILEEYNGEQLDDFLKGIGAVFLNLIYIYYHYYDESKNVPFEMPGGIHRLFYKALLKDLDDTFLNYKNTCDKNKGNAKKKSKSSEQYQQQDYDFNKLNKIIDG